MRALKFLITAVLMILITNGVAQGQGPASASVSPETVTVGDSAVYSVVVEVQGAGQPQVAIPVVDPRTGLSTPKAHRTGTQSSTIGANGRVTVSHTVTYQYMIETSKVGTWEVPPATVTLNGRSYQTNPVKVVVQEVPKVANIPKELEGLVVPPRVQDNPELQRKLAGALFILPVVSNSNPYNGEQVRISYHLVADPDALKAAGVLPQMHIDGYQIPEMDQFIKEDLFGFPQAPEFRERDIGGKMYSVAPIYETAISSTKTGKLDIDPFQISMIFSLQGRRNPFNDPVFSNGPFLNGMNPLAMMGGGAARIVAQSPKLTIDVQPLPTDGKPGDFTGAVGTFTVSSKVNKAKAAAFDDTIELEVTVEGQGDAASLQPPDLGAIKGFQLLGTPHSSTSGRKENDDYISSKKFVYTLRPTLVGTQTVPSVKVSYFDPEADGYATTESDPITVQVTQGSRPATAQQAVDSGKGNAEDAAPETELRYISTGSIGVRSAAFFSPEKPERFLLFLVPLGIAVAGFVAGRKRNPDATEAARKRKRKQIQKAGPVHLKAAQAAFDRGDFVESCTETAAAVRLHLAARYGIPVADATIENLEELMRQDNLSSDYVTGMRDLLERCDAVHYSAAKPSAGDAREILEAASATINGSEAEAA